MIETVDDLARLDGLACAWNELYARSHASNLFLTHAWLRRWARHFAPNDVVAVVRRDGAALTGGAVFARSGGGVLALPDEHTYLPDVLHPVGTPSPLAETLAHVCETTRWIRMSAWPDTPHHRRELSRACLTAGLVALGKHAYVLRHIDTRASFDDYLRGRPGKVRTELSRKHRRLFRELPDAQIARLVGPAAAAEAFEAIEQVEVDTWKAAAGSAIVSSDAERGFYRDVLTIDEPDSAAHTFALRAGGQPIGFITGVIHHRVFYALKTSYRQDHAALAPGQVLQYHLLSELCGARSPVTRVELLGKDSRWKRELATGAETRRYYMLTPADRKGRLQQLTHDRVRPAVQRLVDGDARLSRRWDHIKRIGRRVAGVPEGD